MRKHLLILDTAFNPGHNISESFRQLRFEQFKNTFEKLSQYLNKNNLFDCILIDNTIKDETELSVDLMECINKINGLKKIFFKNNELGSKNKGCGVIVAWKELVKRNVFDGHELCVYFEPRQQLSDFSFFDKFLNEPDNYFKVTRARRTANTKNFIIRNLLKLIPIHYNQVWTGLFSLRCNDFCNYINKANLDHMLKNNTSLEDDMYKKIKGYNKIENYDAGYENNFIFNSSFRLFLHSKLRGANFKSES
ncbi:MAG: hypothetical protein NT091_03010, partial [Candidatus Falkowbacteria bacterium]|nr:hypothetical protein [Candidatus Falkowbacteria bacterium]